MASQVTTISGTGETTIITAGPSGGGNTLLGLVITTTDAAAATITIKDSTGGTTRMVIDYPNAAVAPTNPFVFFFPKDLPLYQSVPANNWTATVSVNAGHVTITAFYRQE
jgi:hypothetical protein